MQPSCPPDCPFFDAGSYAETGFLAPFTRKLNAAAEGMTPLEIAEVEAAAIDVLAADRPLRLHVVGDCMTVAAAELAAAAAERYQARGGQPVWTYRRHGQRARLLRDGGRGAAGAGPRLRCRADASHEAHPSEQTYALEELEIIPCPFETRGISCADCLLCARDEHLLASGKVIGLTAHGGGKRKVRRDRRQDDASSLDGGREV